MQLDIHAINKLSETKEKRPNITHVTEQAIRKTHLKVHRKKARKFPLSYVQRKLVYFAMTRELILRKIRLRNILLKELSSLKKFIVNKLPLLMA